MPTQRQRWSTNYCRERGRGITRGRVSGNTFLAYLPMPSFAICSRRARFSCVGDGWRESRSRRSVGLGCEYKEREFGCREKIIITFKRKKTPGVRGRGGLEKSLLQWCLRHRRQRTLPNASMTQRGGRQLLRLKQSSVRFVASLRQVRARNDACLIKTKLLRRAIVLYLYSDVGSIQHPVQICHAVDLVKR